MTTRRMVTRQIINATMVAAVVVAERLVAGAAFARMAQLLPLIIIGAIAAQLVFAALFSVVGKGLGRFSLMVVIIGTYVGLRFLVLRITGWFP